MSRKQSAPTNSSNHTVSNTNRRRQSAASQQSAALRIVFLIIVMILLSTVFIPNALAASTITGIAFRDADDDGVYDYTLQSIDEGSVNGITVTAYGPTGTQLACDVTGPANCSGGTDGGADGTYTLNLPTSVDGQRVMVVFTTIPTGLFPGRHSGTGADGSGTSVYYLTATSQTVNFPLINPGSYCDSTNPTLYTTCYVFGPQTTADPTVVSMPFNHPEGFASNGVNGFAYELNSNQTGTVTGLAYHNNTDTLALATYVRRHSGSAPNGGIGAEGQIYFYRNGSLTTIDLTPLVPGNFGSDGRSAGWDWIQAGNNVDVPGKNGIGDIDFSDDGTQLFVTNLFQRVIHIFDVSYGSNTTSGYTGSMPTITYNSSLGPYTPSPGCNLGVARPFGLNHHDGKLYSGWVCTAENGGSASDLKAIVFEDGTQIFSMNDLTFDRTNGTGGGSRPIEWIPWSSTVPAAPGNSTYEEPQPMLSDIEFDTHGDMYLAMRDRYGDQVGSASGSNPNNTSLYYAVAEGDMYRVCRIGNTWALEGTANCPQPPTVDDGVYPPESVNNSVARHSNNQGPNGGEFFNDDRFNHPQAMHGHAALLPGVPQVLTTLGDPLSSSGSAGIVWSNLYDGNASSTWNGDFGKRVNIYTGGGNTNGSTFSKSNGLGDIELACAPPSFEIGNLVWLDTDNDGAQQPDESGIAGVLVELVDPSTNTVIATTTSDSTGHYYFNDGPGTTWLINGGNPPVWDINGDGSDAKDPKGIMPNTNYIVRIASTNFNAGQPLNGLNITQINNTTGDLDSEALSVSFISGDFGENDHKFDFGFTSSSTPTPTNTPTNTPTSTPTPTSRNEYDFGDAPDDGKTHGSVSTANYGTTIANNGPQHLIVKELYLGASVDAEADGQPTTGANGDDTNGSPDDEDGIASFPTILANPGSTFTINLTAYNNSGTAAEATIWIDFDQSGTFDADESVRVTIPTGTTSGTTPFTFTVPNDVEPGTTYVRVRYSHDTDLDATGNNVDKEGNVTTDGEVEDYVVEIEKVEATSTPTNTPTPTPVPNTDYDFGDAPDDGGSHGDVTAADYGTTIVNDGPQHLIVNDLYLGASVDGEPDGQPSTGADGDDINGSPDDEDGIASFPTIEANPGSTFTINLTAYNDTGSDAEATIWIDFDQSGTFDADELVRVTIPTGTTSGATAFNFTVPNDVQPGTTYVRVRYSHDTDLDATGNSGGGSKPVTTDGEVEDYVIEIDKVEATNTPTFTPTATSTATVVPPTSTPTATSTPSVTPSNTPTATSTPSVTPSNTPTATSTPSVTPSNTPTATSTPSVTPSNTPTATSTPSVTPSNTPTATSTPSVTPSNTPTATSTPSVTPSNTPTATSTPSVTPSNTPTNTLVPTDTPTNTPVPTDTPTNTSVPTDTPTNTPVPTDTPTNTPVPTDTPTNTPVPTDTPTATSTPSVTPSNTPTNTPVPTDTPTNTPVPTDTPTNTPVPTDTPTNTPVPTDTPTNTPVPTDTPTNTPVPTDTPTNTPVPTDTPTNTSVPTDTPTNTPVPTDTPTATSTPSVTPSNTPTNTPVPTDTPTNTPVPTDTPTNTPVPTDTPTNTPVPTDTPTNTPVPTDTPTNTSVPTDTPTNTPVPTDTPTATSTPSVTPSNTPTNTPVPTDTPTNTPVPTDTPTNTPVPTDTPTNTPVPTDTPTNTPVPTDTPTNTPVPTDTPTNTSVPTDTPTNTPVPTDTPTATSTPSVTPSNTPNNTPVPTDTPTNTPVPTDTPTNTPVPTDTPTNTPVPTDTPTNTPVPTDTPTNTPVPTDTPTNTPVPTDTPTNTPVPTDTPTNTPVPTDTPTNTPVPTDTPTNTPVPTDTPTNTPVPTNTPTNTPVPTDTPTNTPVPTDTPTATSTPSVTPSNTPTNTPVPTDTPTNTPVPTDTPTNTPVPTDTPTNTPVPTDTPTNTPVPTDTPNQHTSTNEHAGTNRYTNQYTCPNGYADEYAGPDRYTNQHTGSDGYANCNQYTECHTV